MIRSPGRLGLRIRSQRRWPSPYVPGRKMLDFGRASGDVPWAHHAHHGHELAPNVTEYGRGLCFVDRLGSWP